MQWEPPHNKYVLQPCAHVRGRHFYDSSIDGVDEIASLRAGALHGSCSGPGMAPVMAITSAIDDAAQSRAANKTVS